MNTLLLTPAQLETLAGGAPPVMHDFNAAPAPTAAPAVIPQPGARPDSTADDDEMLTRAAGGDAVFCHPSANGHAA